MDKMDIDNWPVDRAQLDSRVPLTFDSTIREGHQERKEASDGTVS